MGRGEIVAALRYLAPEQARGDEVVGPGTDVYALGCVLFECLTGRVPFTGEHAALLLTQILYEEAPRLGALRPELPAAFEELFARMLAKQPGGRPADGRALLEALRMVEAPEEGGRTLPAADGEAGLTGEDRRLVSVVLAAPQVPQVPQIPQIEDTEDGERAHGWRKELQERLLGLGAEVEILAGGAVLLCLPHAWGTATDQALQAARAARVLRRHLGPVAAWSLVVATGRGAGAGAELAGEAVRRARELLAEMREASPEEPRSSSAAAQPDIWLDELTAGLLDTRFHMHRRGSGYVLERERMGEEEVRLLLGRRTPYVGRERELELLRLLLRTCREDATARAVMVIGPSGMGKSRLRQEFLQRVEGDGEVEILLGRGDPLRAGAVYGLLGQAVLEWCGEEAPGGEAQRRQLAERVARYVSGPVGHLQRVVEFLGEMCGIPFPDGESPQLRAARQEPRLMNDQVTWAWLELLRGLCGTRTVLLVLDDLHWSDGATMRLVEVALKELADERLLVLGLARPEVKELFPHLWSEGCVTQELWLPRLSRRAGEDLVREMLGERATGETVGRLVEQAEGNALFLEELIRGAAEGETEEPPRTMMAMLQARFVRLEPGLRRLLEVASLLGETFWTGAVVELLRAAGHEAREVDRWLRMLVGAETIVRQGTSRLTGETQYAFRHVTVRDAAYGLLSEADRQAGHALVGRYLEREGEKDLVVLAEHFRLGGEGERAAGYFARAAAQAMEANALAATLSCVERGVACGATGEVLGRLRAMEAWAELWSWNLPGAHAAAQQGVALLPVGSSAWCMATGVGIGLAAMFDPEEMSRLVEGFAAATPARGAEGAFVDASMLVILQTSMRGMREVSGRLLDRAQVLCKRLGANEVRSRGCVGAARTWYDLMFSGDPWPCRVSAERSMDRFAMAGDWRYFGLMQAQLGLVQTLLGEGADAAASCRAAVNLLGPLQEGFILGVAQGQLGFVLAELGEARWGDEALALAEAMIRRQTAPFWILLGQVTRANVLAARGELAQAEAEARLGLATTTLAPAGVALGAATLSRILLAEERVAEALEVAEEGWLRLEGLGGVNFMDVRLLLAVAEARRAAASTEAAAAALREAERRIERRAAQIPEGVGRERYRLEVRDHARVRELLDAAL
jgi:hypothetical protein